MKLANVATGYKKSYDYPNAAGEYICSKCKKTGGLPANYCMDCGKELEDKQKQGLKR